MKNCTKLLLSLLVLSLVCFSGCGPSDPGDATQATLYEPTAAQIYEAACQKLEKAAHLILTYTWSETRTIGEETFTRQVTGTDSLCDLGTETMEALVQQRLSYGTFGADYTELYHAGTAYAAVHGSAFSAAMTGEEFTARLFPRVGISGKLYGEITVAETEETKVLTFLEPTAPESWAVPSSEVTMVSAQGTATLDRSGNLIGYTYSISYKLGETARQVSLKMEISAPKSLDLTAAHPGYPEKTVTLSCLDAPKMTLQAVGDIFSARSISAEETQSINSGALNSLRTYTSSYHITGQGETLTALAKHQITLNDYNSDSTTTTTQTDRFQNGTFSRVINGASPVENPDTPENIRIRWEDPLLNCLFSLNYLSEAVLSETEDAYTLTFTGNDAYHRAIASSLKTILGSDLDSIAESHTTPEASGYLTVSRSTGLPTAMGMHFKRIHVLYGTSYQLSYRLDQKILLASPETAAAIETVQ